MVLAQLDGKDFGRAHLDVHEFDDLAKLRRNAVSDEQHANSPCLQVGLHSGPETITIGIDAKLIAQHIGCVLARLVAVKLEAPAQLFGRPVEDRVGGIVEHLANRFPTYPRIGPSLDLDQRRHAVLVQKEMVKRPAPCPTGFAGDRLLTVDQHEAARIGAIDLIARQKCRKSRQEFLKIVLRGEVRRLHRHEGARLGQQEDTGSRVHIRRSLFRVRGAACLKSSRPAPTLTAVQIAPLALEVEDKRGRAETMEIVSQQSLYGIIPKPDYFILRRLFPARRMAKTLRSSEQRVFLELLRAARKGAGLTQQELAEKLRRPQSFVAKYENGERRIDVVEFVALARALDVSPVALLRRLVEATSPGKDARVKLALHRRRAAKKLER